MVLSAKTRAGAERWFQQKEQHVQGLGLERVNILATPWSQRDWEEGGESGHGQRGSQGVGGSQIKAS